MVDDLLLAIVTLAVIEVFVFGALVGRGRVRYGVKAPATSGPPEWERLNRIHLNSIEQLVVFAPLLMVVSVTVNKTLAATLGLVFVVARVVYAVGYARSAEGRAAGAALTTLVQVLLALAALVGAMYRVLTW